MIILKIIRCQKDISLKILNKIYDVIADFAAAENIPNIHFKLNKKRYG